MWSRMLLLTTKKGSGAEQIGLCMAQSGIKVPSIRPIAKDFSRVSECELNVHISCNVTHCTSSAYSARPACVCDSFYIN